MQDGHHAPSIASKLLLHSGGARSSFKVSRGAISQDIHTLRVVEEHTLTAMADEMVDMQSQSKRQRRATIRFDPGTTEAPKKKRKKRRLSHNAAASDKRMNKKNKKLKNKNSLSLERPKTAYALFALARRKALKASGDKTGATKLISEEWKAMPAEDKATYVARAKEARDAWEEATRARLAKEEARKARRRASVERAAKRRKKERRIPSDAFWTMRADDAPLDEGEWAYRAHALDAGRRVANVDYCDDHCSVCLEGGSLVVCTSCPRAYHTKCLRELGEHAPGDGKRHQSDADDKVGDLGGRNFGKKSGKRGAAHTPDPKALVTATKENPAATGNDDDWHCPVCVRSHTHTCLVCGEAGDSETRLVPCATCPRAYHYRCASQREKLLDAYHQCDNIAFRCVDCTTAATLIDGMVVAQPAAPSIHETRLSVAIESATLEKIAALCATLPRRHFASVWGSRLTHALQLTGRVGDSDEATKALGALDRLHDVEAVCSRLHYAREQVETNGRAGGGSTATRSSDWDARAAEANADEISRRRAQFAIHGLCVMPGALDTQRVDAAKSAAANYFDDAMHTVVQLNLEEHLQHGGFATFKSRDRGRFDLVVPAFASASRRANGHLDFLVDDPVKCPWLDLIKGLVGVDARLCHVGVILALADAAAQPWHSDGDHVHADLQLPPHALNVFVPLVDVDANNGATEFAPGTHLDWNAPDKKVVIQAQAGDAIIFDWRLKHRGLANRKTAPRPLLYLTYGKPWFVDRYNFSSDRYDELPPLVARTSRADRASQRSTTT